MVVVFLVPLVVDSLHVAAIIIIVVVLVVETNVAVLVDEVSSLTQICVFTVANMAIGQTIVSRNNVIRQVCTVWKVFLVIKWLMNILSRQKTENGVDTSVLTEFKCCSLGM